MDDALACRVQRLEDRAAICELQATYCFLVDDGRFDELVDRWFTADARCDFRDTRGAVTPMVSTGHAEIRTFFIQPEGVICPLHIAIPIAIALFFMMYPIMVKIDFAEVLKAGKNIKPVALTLFVNWAIKPFTMYAIALFFLGYVFIGFIGPEAVDFVKMPFGLDLPVGAPYGDGTVVMVDGIKMLEIPLWRSYLAGCILLGIAPCTAMVLVWGYLAKGNDGHTLVMVAINSLTMLLFYGPLGGFLLGIGHRGFHQVPALGGDSGG